MQKNPAAAQRELHCHSSINRSASIFPARGRAVGGGRAGDGWRGFDSQPLRGNWDICLSCQVTCATKWIVVLASSKKILFTTRSVYRILLVGSMGRVARRAKSNPREVVFKPERRKSAKGAGKVTNYCPKIKRLAVSSCLKSSAGHLILPH